MAKAQEGLKIYTSRAVLAGLMTALVAVGMVPIVRAFKIGAGGYPPIHENITSAAMLAVAPQADPMFVINVQSGVYNTDLSHQPIAAFHFDKSTATNGGFDEGFNQIYDMLNRARSEATVWDANGVASVNPLFLNPLHSSFRDLAEDIVQTYGALATNGGCWSELACPSLDFGGSATWMQVEILPILLDTDPDPDEVIAYTPIGIPITVPNFADDLAQAKSNLDALLGTHCRPKWAGGMCFATLELMAPDDNEFQNLAGHLRILQYEYQAYYAWQHLGHAFHTTQDFFAHSNYVELAAGRKGPPCDPTSYEAASLCDASLDNSGPYTAIRLPSDGAGWVGSLTVPKNSSASFMSVFSTQSVRDLLNGLPSVFADPNFDHLQTGYFPCAGDVLGNPATGGVGAGYAQGFFYCHTATKSLTPPTGSAGMNKDKDYEGPGDEPNHQNFSWAEISAQRMSVILFEAFISDLLGPATGGYVSVDSAFAGSQRVGDMAWLSTSNTSGGHSNLVNANSGNPNVVRLPNSGTTNAVIRTQQLQLQLQTQLPALAATVCPSADGKSCASNTAPSSPPWDIVTVTSGGAPVGGANVTTGTQSLAATNANGVAIISRLCYLPGSQVAQIGGKTTPVRTTVPCGQRTATVSMTGYQAVSFSLP